MWKNLTKILPLTSYKNTMLPCGISPYLNSLIVKTVSCVHLLFLGQGPYLDPKKPSNGPKKRLTIHPLLYKWRSPHFFFVFPDWGFCNFHFQVFASESPPWEEVSFFLSCSSNSIINISFFIKTMLFSCMYKRRLNLFLFPANFWYFFIC